MDRCTYQSDVFNFLGCGEVTALSASRLLALREGRALGPQLGSGFIWYLKIVEIISFNAMNINVKN